MGAWGHGYFEDDAAFDFMDEIESSEDPKQLIQETFENALEGDYLETDDANAVIVAATYIDRQVNGTTFTAEDQDEPLEIDTFPERNPDINLADLKPAAIKALELVLSEKSELHELWADNEELYPAWRAGIEQLINRLSE